MAETVNVDDLIRLNPGIWLETHGKIRDVKGKLVRPKLNILQKRINALYLSRQMKKEPCRAIGVKPRKRGFSTMVGAIHYAHLQNYPHEGLIVGDKLATSDIVFRMMVTFAETDEFRPKWGSPYTALTALITWNHGARLAQGTASGKATARGSTPQFCHGSEVAHWEGAEAAMDAAMNAIPDEGFNAVFWESTPYGAGEPFALSWQAARWPTAEECPGGNLYWKKWESLCPDTEKDALSQHFFVRIFAAWYEFEESRIKLTGDQKKQMEETIDAESWYHGERDLISLYGNEGPMGLRLGDEVEDCDVWEQLAWRRVTIRTKCRRNARIFDEEHPRDPLSCFLASGKQVFDADGLSHIQILCRKDREYGELNEVDGSVGWRRSGADSANFWMWEHPKPGLRYIIPVDLAEGDDQSTGDGLDSHSALVLRDEYLDERGTIHPLMIAARVRPPNRMPMIRFAKVIRMLSVYYGRCILIPEMNNSGMSFITALRMMVDCPPIWQRREIDPHSAIERAHDGWRTTDTADYGGLRSAIIDNLQELILDKRLDCRCPHIHSELVDFVDKKGRREAGGGHDDDVLCVVGETLIRCVDGVKPIKEIVVGDQVLTHMGRYRRVFKVMNRTASDVSRVKAVGKPDLLATSEHPLFAAAAGVKYRPRTEGMVRDYAAPEFVAVRDLREKEFGSTSTTGREVEDELFLDLMPYCPPSYHESDGRLVSTTYGGTRINPKAAQIKQFVKVDDDFCQFLGFYYAQGGFGRHTVTLSFNQQHTGIEKWLRSYLTRLGLHCHGQTIDGCRRISFGSMPWIGFFKKEMKKSDKKRFPAWVESLPVEKQKKILEGYFLGDGCFSGGQSNAVTISMTGGWQLWEMAQRCGIEASLKLRPGQNGHKRHVSISIGGPASVRLKAGITSEVMEGKINDISEREFDQTQMKFSHGYLTGLITSITPEPPQEVWNIEVEEDESYTANGHVVHNCLAIGAYNMRFATPFEREIREGRLPADVMRMLASAEASSGGDGGLAMKW